MTMSVRPRSSTASIVPPRTRCSAQCDHQYTVVGRAGAPAPVPVVRQDEQLAAGQLEHIPEASVLVLEEALLEQHGLSVRPEHDTVQMRAAQRREEERATERPDVREE